VSRSIRTAAGDDVVALARLHATCFADAWSDAAMRAFLADPTITITLSFSDSNPVAFLITQTAASEVEILSLGVMPDARKARHASALLSDLVAGARTKAVQRIHLEVAADNAAARALYARHGFHEVGRRIAYYARGDGPRVDALRLARDVR
jgi:ribosomal-protein-alanine N-acetyltransferase